MKKLLATLLASLSLSTPALAGNTFEDHVELWETIQSTGTELYINSPQYCDTPGGAAFISSQRAIVICMISDLGVGVQGEWTSEDLNSLRHEAHHLVQDCLGGSIHDSLLGRLFNTDEGLYSFLSKSSLTEEQLKSIARNYRSIGYNSESILIELEAWVTAEDVPASSITNGIKQFCPTNK